MSTTSAEESTGFGHSPRLALLLKRTEYRESDLIVTLFTTQFGKVQALARGARRSRKRFAGSLEPIHTLEVELDEPKRGDLFELRSATIAHPRVQLPQHLDRLQAAGRILGWLRAALPEKAPDPQLWHLAVVLLDTLETQGPLDCPTTLSVFGLHLLSLLGWEIDFEHCVRCGASCPEHKPGTVSATRGGLVCAACGGAKTRLDAAQRRRFSDASHGRPALVPQDASLALRLVEEALSSHADLV